MNDSENKDLKEKIADFPDIKSTTMTSNETPKGVDEAATSKNGSPPKIPNDARATAETATASPVAPVAPATETTV